ncbi:MAG: MBL fold metallo-hydrolase [Gammaproteobacteria bacterium]|nr:MBL fold metallo-hydrolase [Gammaproteobacteria bacterium]MDH4313500.1 MBL fold metallo-hydrolase [Gammaproteobacteria bacterium]MDH5213880.1 MBL fold metallo-hydrolase [Gammaproteobacteria bacterium]
MNFDVQFLGAAGEVTGSMYLIRAGSHKVLLECGQIQGSRKDELRNRHRFPLKISEINAVILSHAHIDHSGRVPLLAERGYTGPVFTQNATRALCSIMLPDSGYLNEKDAEWENRKRERKGLPPVEPLYTRAEAEESLKLFRSFAYGESQEILPGLSLRFHDAGHILGSSIVELSYASGGQMRTLVFSGDLGYQDAPVMEAPARLKRADMVIMESTYGDRLHRPFAETIEELAGLFAEASARKGNILIPAFTVGRTQDLLYLMSEHYDDWKLSDWQIFLDSPMAIDATHTYAQYRHLYGAKLFSPGASTPDLPNFHATMSTEESMSINRIRSGAIIIAGSGMCSGGRIHHHLKNNLWRKECHLVIVGYQAEGTLGRRLVDGVPSVKLWGEKVIVKAKIHTIGGLSAHADQAGLVDWYGAFENRPPVYLVHGEPGAQEALASALRSRLQAPVTVAERGMTVVVGR